MSAPNWEDSAPNWENLKRREPVAPQADPFNELCAAVFTTGSGKDLLNMMRARTIGRRTGPSAPEATLREDEAVRRFVHDLEKARDRGLELRKPKPAAG